MFFFGMDLQISEFNTWQQHTFLTQLFFLSLLLLSCCWRTLTHSMCRIRTQENSTVEIWFDTMRQMFAACFYNRDIQY